MICLTALCPTVSQLPVACTTEFRYHPHGNFFTTLLLFPQLLSIPDTPQRSLSIARMQRSKDAEHLAIYSDAYPVGPDANGEISYVRFPPLSPLNGTCYLFMTRD
jgi:hypothetical protein